MYQVMLMCGVCHSVVGVGLQRCPVCGSRIQGRQHVKKPAAASEGVMTTSEKPVNYKVCTICKRKISLKAQRCRYCGSKVKTTNYAAILIVALVGVLLVLLFMSAQL